MNKPDSIVRAVYEYSVSGPDQTAIIDHNGSHTYRMLWKDILRAVGVLRCHGVGTGSRVVVQCTQDERFLACGLACGLMGAVFVPTEKKCSPESLQRILEITEAAFYIGEARGTEFGSRISMDEFTEALGEPVSAYEMPHANDLAEILFTTGTTGKSKGIEISHGNNIALAENIISGTQMEEGNVEIIPLPLNHSHGLRTCYANLFRGCTVVLVDGLFNQMRFFDLIDTCGVTSIDISPAGMAVLLKNAQEKLESLNRQIRYIEIGTAFLEENIKQQLIRTFPYSRLYNFYGSTEAGRTCALDFGADRNLPRSIGKPTANAEFVITDDDRRIIQSSAEHMGLVAVKGAMNMQGYLGDPKLTAEIMHDGYIFSNDIGYIDENGYVFVVGRKDNVINYKGVKVAPEEIESIAMKYAGIEDCACVPIKSELSGYAPKLFVVPVSEDSFNKRDFSVFMRRNTDQEKMPVEIAVIEQIPRAENGKKLRRLLAAID